MDDVFVGSLMSAPVRTVGPDASAQAAAAVMRDEAVSSVVVVDDGDRPAGILTPTDYIHITADGIALSAERAPSPPRAVDP